MLRLANLLPLLLASLAVYAAEPAAVVTVRNPINLARSNETIELNAADLRHLLGVEDVRQVHVRDQANGIDLLTQAVDENRDGIYDQYIFQIDIGPNESKSFVLSVGQRKVPRAEDFKAYGRFVQEREGDFAWENDRIAHRMYGAALETYSLDPLTSSAVDVWSKRTPRLIINNWYMVDDYHRDHGEGADLYSSGTSRGCGGNGIWFNGQLYPSANFQHSRTLANGPIRVMFELQYAPWSVGAVRVSETKRITLDAGHNLDRFESWYIFEGNPDRFEEALGIRKNPSSQEITNREGGMLRTWEPLQDDKGALGCGILISPDEAVKFTEADGNYIVVTKLPASRKVEYYAGFGWNQSGHFANVQEWDQYLVDYARKLGAPLQVSIKGQ